MKDKLNIQAILEEHAKWLRGNGGQRADLRRADLWGAYLRGAYLRGADPQGADLQGAYLQGAYLQGADLQLIAQKAMVCPTSGGFTAWKCGAHGSIIKLHIPASAKRLTVIGSRKCRCDLARVEAIWDRNHNPIQECGGKRVIDFMYRVGEVVVPGGFDPDQRVECSRGIHFFITRLEAEEWANS
jgi:hypothetical protein